MFACLFLPPVPASSAAGRSPAAADALAEVAREFSPRVEARGALVTLDIGGLDRLLGDAWAIGREVRRAAADRGLTVHVAVAATRSAAMLLACGRSGLTVARPGEERRLLADLPLSVLEKLTDIDDPSGGSCPGGSHPSLQPGRSLDPVARLDARATARDRSASGLADDSRLLSDRPQRQIAATRPPARGHDTRDPLTPNSQFLSPVLRRWGLRTLGELAALPPAALSERLGQDGVWWQRLACGEDAGPLVPDLPDKRYEASLDLEWPVEGLEPLSFVLARLFEPLCAELAHDDRAAAVLRVAFTLVTREVDTRTLQLPAPMRDPRVLRTLVLLDLEGHPVTAGIDRITVTADPAPGRIVQGSLLGRALPIPEQLAPLVARLGALMGGTRVGAAALVDSHRPEAFRMTPFSSQEPDKATGPGRRPRASPSWTPCAAGLPSREAVGVPDGPVPPSPTADRRPTPHGSMPCRLSPSIARSATSPAQSPQRDTCDLLTPNSQLLIPDTALQVPSTKYQVLRPCPPSLSTIHYPLSTVLRRFRFPVPARVQVEEGAPVRVVTERAGLAGGRVERAAGPWRTSGEWWQLSDARLQPRTDGRPVQVGWNRDEWDVALGDGGIYRVYRDRDRNRWFVDGIVD